MFILAFSTSSPRGSVALLDAGTLQGERHYLDERRHAERIFDEIDLLLGEHGVAPTQLGAIVCDVGPGSFTGTRVGLSSAKGMAMGLGLPLWPACALQAMALAALSSGETSDKIMPCVDAKRGEVFYAVYNSALEELLAPTQVSRKRLAQVAAEQMAGGAICCGAVLAELEEAPSPRVQAAACAGPDAQWLGKLAWRLHHDTPSAEQDAAALALIEPIYVRAPDAVPNLPKPLVLQP